MTSALSVAGPLMSVVAPFTGPAAPFLMAGGALAGGIGGTLSQMNAASGVDRSAKQLASTAGMILQGSRLQAEGILQEGEEQARAAALNAQLANEDAGMVELFSQYRALQTRQAGKRQVGSIRKNAAASGVSTASGSPLLTIRTQVAEAEKSALFEEYNGQLQGKRFKLEAVESMRRANMARHSAALRAKGTLLTGSLQASAVQTQAGALTAQAASGRQEAMINSINLLPSAFKLFGAAYNPLKSLFTITTPETNPNTGLNTPGSQPELG